MNNKRLEGLLNCDRGRRRPILVKGRFARKKMQVTGMGAPTRAIAGKAFRGRTQQRSIQDKARCSSDANVAMPRTRKRKEAKDGVKESNKGKMNGMGFQWAEKKRVWSFCERQDS